LSLFNRSKSSGRAATKITRSPAATPAAVIGKTIRAAAEFFSYLRRKSLAPGNESRPLFWSGQKSLPGPDLATA
jgi:hypothetical protein